ncbi:MAG: transcriptional regulator [Alphaproteobacteria bacterium PA2]|nr:MAG: transcriptional regulator [Alphaproteobacteria bacterium PA2]
MHPAPIFAVEAIGPILEHLKRHPLAAISAAPEGRIRVAHAPVLARELEGGTVLDFHLSRNNALAGHIEAGFEAVAVSMGPEAYVSPDWYASDDQVPTWNYMSVELEGVVAPLDEAGLVALLDDLSAQEEARLAPKPAWTRNKMSVGRFDAMLRGIVGARLAITRLEATFKLSQNKSADDRQGVIAALGAHPLARAMQALK